MIYLYEWGASFEPVVLDDAHVKAYNLYQRELEREAYSAYEARKQREADVWW